VSKAHHYIVTKNPSGQKIYIDSRPFRKKPENVNYWDNSYIYPTNCCMRKSASIILLLIFLFNVIGYRALFYYAEKKADVSMEARLDKDQYNENELVTVRVPLFNPYQLEQKSFERVHGEINVNGKIFKYVKRKVSDGYLILQCIADNPKNVLKTAKSEYENAVNDLTTNNKSSGRSGLQKNFKISDYIQQNTNVEVGGCGRSNLNHTTFHIASVRDPLISMPGKPPEYKA
jgi:hypothetical protein